MSRTLLRSVMELRAATATPRFAVTRPAFTTAFPIRRFNSTAPIIEPTPSTPEAPITTPAPETPVTPISDSVRQLLPVLAAQPGHYITINIHGWPFLVTKGDQVRLPFRIPGSVPGDKLKLNCASLLGSRDLTLKGAPYIDERLYECTAVVTGEESEPMRVKLKTKRRNRKVKHAKSKHRYTILRISELKVNDVPQ